jgi:hypothetical protein
VDLVERWRLGRDQTEYYLQTYLRRAEGGVTPRDALYADYVKGWSDPDSRPLKKKQFYQAVREQFPGVESGQADLRDADGVPTRPQCWKGLECLRPLRVRSGETEEAHYTE